MTVCRIRYFCLILACLGWLSISVRAEEVRPSDMTVDLDGDGRPERITWVKFTETEDEGEFFQVRVMDAAGGLLWEGPKVTDTENPLVFGNWHFGYSLPELAADIDGDGAIELVTPAPQSDVSPTWYRIIRWQGGRFVPVRMGMLLETPRGTGKFPWSKSDEWQGTWISSFLGVESDGSLRVEVFEYGGGVTTRQGEALVGIEKDGYVVKRWTRPLKALTDMPSPVAGDEPLPGGVVVYRARLGAGDHFNSTGERLAKVSDILRQDRANYANGKGDDEDGPDPRFSTREARDGMDKLTPVPVDMGEAAWREAIVNGQPLVEVEVKDTTLNVKILSR
ncbi:MAG: hypothetical protein KDN19_12850 [Verrucomicrobiae bacterium]|nr:hypothetical protein [Verrucomicrobiae bacterium]